MIVTKPAIPTYDSLLRSMQQDIVEIYLYNSATIN